MFTLNTNTDTGPRGRGDTDVWRATSPCGRKRPQPPPDTGPSSPGFASGKSKRPQESVRGAFSAPCHPGTCPSLILISSSKLTRRAGTDAGCAGHRALWEDSEGGRGRRGTGGRGGDEWPRGSSDEFYVLNGSALVLTLTLWMWVISLKGV